MNAAYRGAAQAGIAMPALSVHTAFFHQVFVQLLKVMGGQLLQFDLSNAGDGIGIDHQAVPICCRYPDIWFGIEFIPGFEPGGHGVFILAAHIKNLRLRHSRFQLFLDLGLRFAQYIFIDPLSCF